MVRSIWTQEPYKTKFTQTTIMKKSKVNVIYYLKFIDAGLWILFA